MLVVTGRCDVHVHATHRPPRPSLEIATAVLPGLARCWTELDRICADWERRPPQPVSQVAIFAAIRRVRAEEQKRARDQESAARRRRRPPTPVDLVPPIDLGWSRPVARLDWDWPPPREVAPQLYRAVWTGRQMVWARVTGTLNVPRPR